VSASLSGYQTQTLIGSIVTDEIVSGAIGAAIRQAAQEIDIEELTAQLAKELTRAVTRATLLMLQEAVTNTLCKLRNIGDYSAEDRAARAAVRIELFSEKE